jgi:ABC-type branched-subunit amino acid transport system ATPase component
VTATTYAFQAEGLVKRYGETTALAGVDLAARPGTVLGVLGPNGAGKTIDDLGLSSLTGSFSQVRHHAGHWPSQEM